MFFDVILMYVVMGVLMHHLGTIVGGQIMVMVGLFLFIEGIKNGLMPLGTKIGNGIPNAVPPWALYIITFITGIIGMILKKEKKEKGYCTRVLSSVRSDPLSLLFTSHPKILLLCLVWALGDPGFWAFGSSGSEEREKKKKKLLSCVSACHGVTW